MALSRSSHGRFQAWAIRAIAGFLVVYILGAFGIPTQIPYIAVMIATFVDGLRLLMQRAPRHGGREETIH
jgi:hypothetical protein